MRSVLARAAQDSTRLVDVQGTIFETPAMNDCFAQERTVAKNAAMTELRTMQPSVHCLKTSIPISVGHLGRQHKTMLNEFYE